MLEGELSMVAVRVMRPADVPACRVGARGKRAVVEPFEIEKAMVREFAGTKTRVESLRPVVSGRN
jgi:hypothetical protein